jgi:hypothetical protein
MTKKVLIIPFMVSTIKKLTAPSGFQSPKPMISKPGSSTTFWTGTLPKVQFNLWIMVLSSSLTRVTMLQAVSSE